MKISDKQLEHIIKSVMRTSDDRKGKELAVRRAIVAVEGLYALEMERTNEC